ncbi:GLPGLI family protein [Flavobacterium sp. j3]|uniref:GLPGLI family protein n=1 Tax=Flavobacterium aureirubrum TaxID=3133147 RepID=A0ABU9N4E0_9FLAO
MKTYLPLLLLFTFSFIYSQNKSGIATYKLQIAFDKDALEVDKKYGYLQKAIDICNDLEYKLVFNKNEANFFQEENQKLDIVATNMANILSETPKISYQNIEQNILLSELKADGILIQQKEFLIKEDLKINWTITSESKLIDNYLCYKALTTKIVYKGDKGFNENVIAWFCPTIPFSFGPTKYSGLPGLILELQEKNIAFTLKSLTLNDNDIVKIIIATAKKTISQTEYNDIVKTRMETLQSMSKQK